MPTIFGYLQGKPIKIAEKIGNNEYLYYQNGFNIPSSDQNGMCVTDITRVESINFNKILFKTNHMFSCRYNEDPKETNIYRKICSSNLLLRVATALNSSLSDISSSNSWIDVTPNQNDCQGNFTSGRNIKIQLAILTSKEGKENQPYEYIKYAKFFFTNSENTNSNNTISFKVNFIDFSFNTIENYRNNKVTSFTSLPNEAIDILTDKYKS